MAFLITKELIFWLPNFGSFFTLIFSLLKNLAFPNQQGTILTEFKASKRA